MTSGSAALRRSNGTAANDLIRSRRVVCTHVSFVISRSNMHCPTAILCLFCRETTARIDKNQKTMKTLFASLLLLSSPLFAQVLAIRAGNVVDPAHGAVARDQIIVVENGKIKSIGAA